MTLLYTPSPERQANSFGKTFLTGESVSTAQKSYLGVGKVCFGVSGVGFGFRVGSGRLRRTDISMAMLRASLDFEKALEISEIAAVLAAADRLG